jgi:hypothetical protein
MEKEPGYDFTTASRGDKRYKVFGIVTNMGWDGAELIRWLISRYGQSEEANRAISRTRMGKLEAMGKAPRPCEYRGSGFGNTVMS